MTSKNPGLTLLEAHNLNPWAAKKHDQLLLTITPFSKSRFWEGKLFLVQSAAQKWSKNYQINLLIILARDERFSFFPWKWSIFHWINSYNFAKFLLVYLLLLGLFSIMKNAIWKTWKTFLKMGKKDQIKKKDIKGKKIRKCNKVLRNTPSRIYQHFVLV